VLFFHATRSNLAPINPLGKFLCVKVGTALSLLPHQVWGSST
jgi:hypothetical protein